MPTENLFRLAVRTVPFHGENTGSIPVRGIKLYVLNIKIKMLFVENFNLLFSPLDQFDDML